jgi:hypothetical protein
MFLPLILLLHNSSSFLLFISLILPFLATEEEFEQLKKEMAGKDDVINRLSEEIKSSRRQSSQNNLNPSAASAASKEAGRPATALWEEVERLRESNQAHQNQNVLLCAEIK